MTTQDYGLSIEPHLVKNFWPGRDGYMPMVIVEHTMQGTLEETLQYFNREMGEHFVSAHYGIGQDGRIWQFVRDEDTAWANGVLQEPDTSIDWLKEVYEEGVNPNLISLAIEYEGFSGEPLTEAQYEAALELHRRLLERWEIPADPNHILGHDRLDSVERNLNPGPAFPWTRLLDDLKLGQASFKSETIVAGEAPEPEPVILLTPSETELEPLETPAEASLIDETITSEFDEETLPITLDDILQTAPSQTVPVEVVNNVNLPEIEPVEERSFPEVVSVEKESSLEPELADALDLPEFAAFEPVAAPDVATFEPDATSEVAFEQKALPEAEQATPSHFYEEEPDEPPSLYELELAEQASRASLGMNQPLNIVQPEVAEPVNVAEAEAEAVAPEMSATEAEAVEPSTVAAPESVHQPAMDEHEVAEPVNLVEPESFSPEESSKDEAPPPEGLSDLIFDFDEDFPPDLLGKPAEAPSEVEQQVASEVELAHAEVQEPAPLLPLDEAPVKEPAKTQQSEVAPEPEVAETWALPEIFEEEAHSQPELKEEELPWFMSPKAPESEVPDVLNAPPAVQPEATSEPTVIAVPPRDPLEELDDLIFEDNLPPGVKEEEIPSLVEATSGKVDLPDFDDFDSLFDEISGLGDPVSKVEIKPFEVEGAPRSSAPIAPTPVAKKEEPAHVAAPPPDDLSGYIAAPVGGGVVAVELANIRKRPSYDPNTVMRTAAKNTRYNFDGYTEGPELQGSTRWFHITQIDGSGWIHSVLVQLDEPFTPAEHES